LLKNCQIAQVIYDQKSYVSEPGRCHMSTSRKEQIRFKDRLLKGIDELGHFKISAVKTTDVIRSARKQHNLSLLNTVLLGRTLTAAMLLASELKGEERIRLILEGNGPVGSLVAEANRRGEIRGYAANPSTELDYSDGETTLGDGLGIGVLTVTKTLYNEAEPRQSTIQLFKGDVSTDIAHYLAQSEQIPSAVLLDTGIDEKGNVTHSGGILVQRLPGAPDEVIETLQKRLSLFGNISELLQEGEYIDSIMKRAGEPYNVREIERLQVQFFCRCNRDRFLSALSMLSYEDLREMEGEDQEIVCHFCNNRVSVTAGEIRQLVSAARAKLN